MLYNDDCINVFPNGGWHNDTICTAEIKRSTKVRKLF